MALMPVELNPNHATLPLDQNCLAQCLCLLCSLVHTRISPMKQSTKFLGIIIYWFRSILFPIKNLGVSGTQGNSLNAPLSSIYSINNALNDPIKLKVRCENNAMLTLFPFSYANLLIDNVRKLHWYWPLKYRVLMFTLICIISAVSIHTFSILSPITIYSKVKGCSNELLARLAMQQPDVTSPNLLLHRV